ncbi:MAG: hypothetical protein M3436_09080 [Pseudomonadota bacterium]|nr:hypothetical protein [Pseudomonadota bacterium]
MTTGASGFRRRVFVVMPFGTKEVPKKPRVDAPPAPEASAEALKVDFDSVYQRLFKPALEAAGLQPFRADDEEAAGDILKDMFAELVTADFVLADISILNANVFYELGIRHTVGPRGVICLHAGWADRPFDVAPQRTFKYEGKLFQVGNPREGDWEKVLAREVANLAATLRAAIAADRTTESSPVYSNLPNLQPVDASRIGTARFKHYQGQADEWNRRVLTASHEGWAEDILTLADDVPSPYFRRKLLRDCGDALLALGRFSQAEKILRQLADDLEGIGSAEEIRVKCQLALIANRLKRRREAKERLAQLAQTNPNDPEVPGLMGRVYKDMWRTTFDGLDKLEDRLRIAMRNAALARKSLRSYEVALRRDLGRSYNGINVVSLAALLDHVARENQRTPKLEVPDLEDLKIVVRLAATGKVEQPGEEVWARATLGNLHLVNGEAGEALDEYEQASADPSLSWFHVSSMFEQVQLFQLLGFQTGAVDPVAKLLKSRGDELGRPHDSFGKVAICSGHIIDEPGRTPPRFPREKEDAVRAEIAKRLDQWNIGAGDLAVCGAARGADILFAEECAKRGARIRLLIARDLDAFVERSVRLPDSDWSARFYALYAKSEVAIQPERLGRPPEGVSPYARNNRWIVNMARVEGESSRKILALIVWDERESEGQGGAAHFAQIAGPCAGEVAIVNPELVSELPTVPK